MNRPPDDITLPELARLAVEAFIGEGERIEPPAKPQGEAGRARRRVRYAENFGRRVARVHRDYRTSACDRSRRDNPQRNQRGDL